MQILFPVLPVLGIAMALRAGSVIPGLGFMSLMVGIVALVMAVLAVIYTVAVKASGDFRVGADPTLYSIYSVIRNVVTLLL